ncbi:MAG: NAD(P)H-hydrate dehydratase [Gammaproteobacteria bacterium]|nr:NAD(P)H-hydrate dehydratase [Gammaproteobacteria bacterium]MYF01523.1 NAD(P)H-hydrate dehydratase [Gammaproteobacteria bacterium]MYI77687.1 NAD(P)H-hydrate dehydratase [Gammaproteobacteria bacterium]
MSLISKVYTADECRELDRFAIEKHDIPGFTLMQRAGAFVFTTIQDRWSDIRSLRVVAGSGNNAGDGYVVALLAHQAGIATEVYQIGATNRISGDALLAWQQLNEHEVPVVDELNEADVVVDALLGTGARGSLSPEYESAIAHINNFNGPVVAIDVPSGVEASSGGLLTENPVTSDLTCMFIGAKLGLFTGPGLRYRGDLVFTDLGVPTEVYQDSFGVPLLDTTIKRPALPPRDPLAHKFKFGHVLVVGGDHGMGGAVILTAEAALRTGAGLVTVLTRTENVPSVLARRPEIMAVGVDESTDISSQLARADVLAIGPGLGQGTWGQTLLKTALAHPPVHSILDADALRTLKSQEWTVPEGCIFTPHPGEAAFISGVSTEDIQTNRPRFAQTISHQYGCTVILKGPGSLIASEGQLCSVSQFVDGALATAGSGDVLTGIAAAAYARCGNPIEAAAVAVSLHGAAGARAIRENPDRSLIASDLIDALRI